MSIGLTLHSCNTFELMGSLKTENDQYLYSRTRDVAFFIPHICLPFQILAPTLPTVQLCRWVTSLEAVYQIRHSFLWSHKVLLTTFFTFAEVLTMTCKHTLMCKTGGVTLSVPQGLVQFDLHSTLCVKSHKPHSDTLNWIEQTVSLYPA